EAKWLVPAGTLPADVARDPKSCLIAVTIELREHAIAHAARVLRESGATPAQTKVGIHLALGKPRAVIADELGLQRSSVADHTKKLYQTLDVHNSTELGTKVWLNPKQDEARRGEVPALFSRTGFANCSIDLMPSPTGARMNNGLHGSCLLAVRRLGALIVKVGLDLGALRRQMKLSF